MIKDDRVFLSAQPLAAAAHKAILSLADAIDAELAGCAAIADQQPFHHCIGFNDEKRDWPLAPACHRDVKPRDQRYEYIDGAFRPNTPKLLQLLSGTQLYDTPLAAVRELLQNAFDAVREKIARRRLQQENPGDPKWATQLGNHEHVILTLIQEPDGTLRLSCQDTGCGMTKAIIQNHLLISGDARRPPIIELERQCEAAGFHLGRTGQFGIGVLSYFMLAESVKIETCRLQDCGDLDAPGWAFTTTGVGDFGELRKLPTQPPAGAGTLIEWTLDPKQFPHTSKLATDIEKYLREQLVKIPCTFRFLTKLNGAKQTRIDFATGWTYSHKDIIEVMTAEWQDLMDVGSEWHPTVSKKVLAQWQLRRAKLDVWTVKAHRAIRLEERVVPLAKGCGTARILLPWFDLPEGPALAFVLFDRENEGRVSSKNEILQPRPSRKAAWKGIRADVCNIQPDEDDYAMLLEHSSDELGWIEYDFDCLPSAQLQVHRSSLLIEEKLQLKCMDQIEAMLKSMAADIMSRGPQPPFYCMLTKTLLSEPVQIEAGQGWWVQRGEHSHFQAVQLPAIAFNHPVLAIHWHRSGRKNLDWQNQPLTVLSSGARFRESEVSLINHCVPERIVAVCSVMSDGRTEHLPALFWTNSSSVKASDGFPAFPPEWESVWGWDRSFEGCYFNQANWAIRLVLASLPEKKLFAMSFGKTDWRKAATITTSAEAALVLLSCSQEMNHESLKNLEENQPGLLSKLWKICAMDIGCPEEDLYLQHFSEDGTCRFSSSTYQRKSFVTGIGSNLTLEVTDPEWLIEFK